MNQPAPLLTFATRRAWRAWLERHHASARVAWLVYFKQHTGRPSIPYEDSVEEALCFGWIDGVIRSLDEERYARRFTPRLPGSRWSASNRRRAYKMIQEEMMTPAGLAKLDVKGKAGGITSRTKTPAPHPEFVKALKSHPKALENFKRLAPSHRRMYVLWIMDAKKEETRARRIAEAVERLALNQKLGMK
jgi:uncharacterized protein YdeI (YjbR/CyaY-like superfamily)